MNAQALVDTARALVACDKGLLAMDDSNPTCKRFAKQEVPKTEEARQELIATTHGQGDASVAQPSSTRRSSSG
jgi:fructose-bisphosphate aldolase class I